MHHRCIATYASWSSGGIVSAVSLESKLFHDLSPCNSASDYLDESLSIPRQAQRFTFKARIITNVSKQFLDRFLELNAKEKEGHNLDLAIVIITDLSKTYTETSKSPMIGTCSPAPFQGRSAEGCFELLQEFARDTGSEIDVEIFAILDERSREDDTVCIVKASKRTGEIKTVRGALRQTDMSLVNLWVGNLNIEECSYELVD